MIKAKQSVYSGVLFRSLLEIRWAALLDYFGYRWDYEPKAFTVSSGGYLPDFYLPDLGMWAEVKPGPLDAEALRKIMDVSAQTGESALLLEGNPTRNVRMVQFCGDMQALHLYKGLHVVQFKLG